MLRIPVLLLWNLLKVVLGVPAWLLSGRWLRRPPRVVKLRLRGELPELSPPGPGWLAQRLGARAGGAGGGDVARSVEELARACRRLADDRRTDAVIVCIGPLRIGWARARSVRAALASVKAAGKRVLAFLEEAGNLEYYVATAATEIVAPPQAQIGLAGVAATATFLADALQRAGVSAEFAAIGRYKSAPETFTRAAMSEAHRESVEAVLADLMDELCAAVAEGRGCSAAEARAKMDAGPYLAPRAKAAGLLDAVAYEDEMGARAFGAPAAAAAAAAAARAVAGSESPESGGEGAARDTDAEAADRRIATYAAWERARRPPVRWTKLRRRPAVAVLDWRGTIVQGEGGGLTALRGAIASGPAVRELRAARAVRRARAVVVHVDSRGGSANASDVIAREMRLLAAKKPLIVYMGETAASGGYYLAAAATRVVAQPTTLTGSIGVFAGKFSAAAGLGKLGVQQEVLAGAAHAAMHSTARPFTAEERALLEQEVGAVYDAFVAHVAAGRKLAPEAVRAAAEGRVWSARRAAERGLVDVLGGFEDAVKAAAAAAKLPEGVEPERLRVRARAPGGALRALLDAVRPGGRAEEGAGAGGAGAAAAAAAAVLEWIGGVGLEELGEAAALAGDGDGGGRGRAWALWPWRWTFK